MPGKDVTGQYHTGHSAMLDTAQKMHRGDVQEICLS